MTDPAAVFFLPVRTNIKSVYAEVMLENVIDVAALPKVVVAIGSYVAPAAIVYAPLIP